MACRIKVNELGEPRIVNMDLIVRYFRIGGCTCMVCPNGDSFYVKESVEEVTCLINAEKAGYVNQNKSY